MFWSLVLPPRPLPKRSHGVSRQSARVLRTTRRGKSELPVRPWLCTFSTSGDLSDQWCARYAALMAYGVSTRLEEQPITAA
jgi:hypothetical protein